MHYFLYPSEDTYITSEPGYADRNFGIDEILQVGTSNVLTKTLSNTKNYTYTADILTYYPVEYYTGLFTGSFRSNVVYLYGNLSGSSLLTASYFSGSVDGGTISIYSGSAISGSLNGLLSGSLSSSLWIETFTGQLTGSIGCLNGTASGIDIRVQPNWITYTTKYIDRSLLKFNLSTISASIANGTITNPKFKLKLKVCNEYELPITYTIYALPISQSWNMGNGYYSDDGSTEGVSWQYRDFDDGTTWDTTYTSSARPAIDFITYPASATQSFKYGGGTWYTSSVTASQTFSYESSDINMDVTDIVMSWLSSSLPNNGFILVSSDELRTTGSGFTLKFYSKDTNTIYSPYLDVMWLGNGYGGVSSLEYITGSQTTSSVSISTHTSSINVYIQSGSTLILNGGFYGIFSGSTYIHTSLNYVTASELSINQTIELVTASFTGSINGYATYVSGTLSGSGWFTSSYFSGSIDGSSFIINNTGISSSLIDGIISGSLSTTGSITTFTGEITSSIISLAGNISGYYYDENNYHVNGIVDGKGLSGQINGIPIVGYYDGTLTKNITIVTGSCGKSFSSQFITASITSGMFSGSKFTAYYTDDYKLENAILTGSWNSDSLLGVYVNIPIPSNIDPFAYAYVSGTYVYGKALGIYTISGSISGSVGSESASFSGQFINGNLRGSTINLQLSGSIYTSSYTYTSSVNFTSSNLNVLNTNNPFTVIIKNMYPTYKSGDIIKFYVFSRKQYPLKTFGISTQQESYLTPEYLPTSSFYALKDNETGEIVINFDNYTQLSCEYPNGNYFVIDSTGIPQERYYKILIRIENNGFIYTKDCGKVFKLVR